MNTNVSTIAGNGTAGKVDGTGTAAQLYYPYAMVFDSSGNMYVVDDGSDLIRKITPAGVVTTFAGSVTGYVDGTGTAARFNSPMDIAKDSSGNLYVTDYWNLAIRKITPAGVVTTLYKGNQQIDGYQAFNAIDGIVIDSSGNVYAIDITYGRIFKITQGGVATVFAGGYTLGAAASSTDGTGTAARFNKPARMVLDSAGNFYVTELNGHRIRKITPAGVVTTFAGSGVAGYADGTGTAAQFNTPRGITIDSAGNLYVTDINNQRIRKITSAGVVTTIAGNGAAGYTDGTGTAAQFNSPRGIAVDSSGNLYVADTNNNRIRKITRACTEPSGTQYVTTTCTFLVDTQFGTKPTCSSTQYLNGYTSGSSSSVGTSGSCTNCTSPSGTQYVTTACTTTSDTQFGTKPTCTSTQYLSGYTSGSSSSVGTSGSCTNCTSPSGTQYVTTACTTTSNTQFGTRPTCTSTQYLSGYTSGSISSVGTPGTCTNCSSPGVGQYIQTPCSTTSDAVISGCPNGQYLSSQTSTCIQCSLPTANQYVTSICTATSNTQFETKQTCYANTYLNGFRSGSWNSLGSQGTCNTCPEGTLFTLGTACLNICPPGKWYNSTLAKCNTCSSGTYYVGPGASSINDCMSCDPGSYSGIGSPTCTKCPPGTSFAGSRGTSNTVCTPCTSGNYSNSFGSITCSACPPGTSSSTGSTFCYRATGGNIEDRGTYITHSFTSDGNFVTLSPIYIYDELVITSTSVYSKGPRYIGLMTSSIVVSPSITGLVDRGSTYQTDFGNFQIGNPRYIIVYLKDPCPAATPYWNPIDKQCTATCPLTSNISNTCTSCASFTQIRSIPSVGSAYCEAGFTLSNLTCTRSVLSCPDPSWTLSGSLCTKKQTSCPPESVFMPRKYCLYSNGVSMLQTTVDMIQSATPTTISKPAYGPCVTSCPIGSYKDKNCVKCPGIQTTLNEGSTRITDCICPIGTYGINGSGVCTSCGQDQTSPLGTQMQSGCVLYCPTGSYENNGTCKVCPYGTSPAGSMGVYACNCSQGTYLNGGSCIANCPSGMYGDSNTGSCTPCPGQQVSPAGSTSVYKCTCPDGFGGTNGSGICTECTGGQITISSNTVCPDETWSVVGTSCVKNIKDCPSNGTYYKTADTCYSTEYTASSGCTVKNYTCPSGWTLNGSVCLKTGEPMSAANITYTCPTGAYTCPPNSDNLNGFVCRSLSSLYYSCPNGGSIPSNGTFGVGGWVLDGTTCKRYKCTKTTSSANGTYISINGSTCTFYNSTYSCPTYYTYGPDTSTYYTQQAGLLGCSNVGATTYTTYTFTNGPYSSGTVTYTTTTLTQAERIALGYSTDPNTTWYKTIPTYHLSATPYSENVTTTLYDSMPATPNYGTVPAIPTMVDQTVTTGKLTRTDTRIISIENSASSFEGVIANRRCGCSSNQFWDFNVEQCVTNCPEATYGDSITRMCQPCPANKTSPIGSTSISQCTCSYAFPYWSGFSCMQQINPTLPINTNVTPRYENKYTIYEFTTSATINILTPVIANVLLVGGGAGGSNDGKPGYGGNINLQTNYTLPTGLNNISIGSGGNPNSAGNTTKLQTISVSSSGAYLYTDVLVANGGTVATDKTSKKITYKNLGTADSFLFCPYS